MGIVVVKDADFARGDLLISGHGAFISYVHGALGIEYVVKVPDGNGEINSGMGIKKGA